MMAASRPATARSDRRSTVVTDGAVTDPDATVGADGAVSVDTGDPGTGFPGIPDDDSCQCSSARTTQRSPPPWALAAVLVFALARRRRSRR
jgi:MYXO-CTERM domain-containing protein